MGTPFDLLQGVSKGFWAGGLGAPVDLTALAVNSLIAGGGYVGHKAGLLKTPPSLIEKPVGGSEWIADKLRGAGLLQDNPGSTADNFGNVIGGLLGPVAAAKAPQISGGLLRMADNAATPSTLNKQAGMALFDLTGLPNKGRELIRTSAEDLAGQLRAKGFVADVQHSGSIAGPSSYVSVFDPKTGRVFKNQVRLSGHSKGVFNSQDVWDVNRAEFNDVLNAADKMRAQGASKLWEEKLAQDAARAAYLADPVSSLASSIRPKVSKAFQEARDTGVDFSRYRAR